MRRDAQRLLKPRKTVKIHRPGRAPRNIEELPFSEPMLPKNIWRGHQRFRDAAVKRFMKRRVGRGWNRVHSEVSRRSDPRSYWGKTMRDVVENTLRCHDFYVDEDGRLAEDIRARPIRRRRQREAATATLGSMRYDLVDGFWYRSIWRPLTPPPMRHSIIDDRLIPSYRTLWCYVEGTLHWGNGSWSNGRWRTVTQRCIRREQASKLEVERINASLNGSRRATTDRFRYMKPTKARDPERIKIVNEGSSKLYSSRRRACPIEAWGQEILR